MALRLHQDELPTINLTSMIDILFLLIIFFMVGSHLGEEEQSFKMTLAQSSGGEALAAGPDHKIINITNRQSIVFEQRELPLEERSLQFVTDSMAQLKKTYPNLRFSIRPGDEINGKTIGRVARAGTLGGAKLEKIVFAETR